jgi:hypothetical protein
MKKVANRAKVFGPFFVPKKTPQRLQHGCLRPHSGQLFYTPKIQKENPLVAIDISDLAQAL